ncbi:MAG: hypothetical protein ACREFO_06200 [Acetobacteraceae bacterium]
MNREAPEPQGCASLSGGFDWPERADRIRASISWLCVPMWRRRTHAAAEQVKRAFDRVRLGALGVPSGHELAIRCNQIIAYHQAALRDELARIDALERQLSVSAAARGSPATGP